MKPVVVPWGQVYHALEERRILVDKEPPVVLGGGVDPPVGPLAVPQAQEVVDGVVHSLDLLEEAARVATLPRDLPVGGRHHWAVVTNGAHAGLKAPREEVPKADVLAQTVPLGFVQLAGEQLGVEPQHNDVNPERKNSVVGDGAPVARQQAQRDLSEAAHIPPDLRLVGHRQLLEQLLVTLLAVSLLTTEPRLLGGAASPLVLEPHQEGKDAQNEDGPEVVVSQRLDHQKHGKAQRAQPRS